MYMRICTHACVCVYMSRHQCGWRVENNFMDLVLFCYLYAGLGIELGSPSLCNKRPCPLSHRTSPSGVLIRALMPSCP